MPKRNGRRWSRRSTCSSKPHGRKSSLRAAKRRKRPFGAPMWILAIAYPITPQSETMQLIGVLYGEGYVKEYYRGEEEVGVMAAMAGGSRAGVRCFTATAGPGTLRRLGRHRVMARASAACRRHVHLPRCQRSVGHSAGQYRSCLFIELRHDRASMLKTNKTCTISSWRGSRSAKRTM